MAPKATALEAALKNAVRNLYEEVGDQISVNAVRKQAEDEMGLDEGFFVSEDWKARSKTIIKEAMVSLWTLTTHRNLVANQLSNRTLFSTKERKTMNQNQNQNQLVQSRKRKQSAPKPPSSASPAGPKNLRRPSGERERPRRLQLRRRLSKRIRPLLISRSSRS